MDVTCDDIHELIARGETPASEAELRHLEACAGCRALAADGGAVGDGLAALRADPPEVEAMRKELDGRRRVLLEGLAALDLPTPEPRGAFYAFPDVSAHLDERGSTGFCEDVLDQELLAVVPGVAFGVEGHVRLCYALDLDSIREALVRLERFLGARRVVVAQSQPARSTNQ